MTDMARLKKDTGAATASPEQAAPAVDEAAAQADRPSIAVIGPTRGRWRTGRFFGPAAVTIPLEDLTEDEVIAILADHELVVVWDNPDPAPGPM